MKLCKLFVHTKSFCGEDLIINPKGFPNLQKSDIVEIYHPEDEFSRLLLQITLFKEDLQGRDGVSVEQSIATTFQLRTYADIIVNAVSPESVILDSVEIIFKDQYMGRSEMWRLKNSLVNSCVYLNKKLEFCGGSVRCQVYEMWAMGDRVACGVIDKSTKIVFRSSTSMVYLFLQMSSEMWDFDIHGDLYFEKAVNGFLADLFQKWKKHGSNHEVTIVLFSRTFYNAHNLDEFPQHMRECLQQDYKGRFYEDFYRVAVQNERYDDWSNILVELRRLFSDYQQSVLEYNNRPDVIIPKASNSTAAQGNFLEVLNMSLNVFEKHYLDRSFDRTGQLSVVITPGVGVFEVDRKLTNVTKQRVIDNGVGSDLVCLGEQPLHAVPLLKFHNKDALITADAYSMPHWINLSFYSSNKRVAYSNFIPRIKLPPKRNTSTVSRSISTDESVRTKTVQEDEDPLAVTDYDAYDSQVFNVPTVQLNKNSRVLKKTSFCGVENSVASDSKSIRRKMSDPDLHRNTNFGFRNKTQAVPIPPLNSPILDQLSPTNFINNYAKDENESPPWIPPYNIQPPRSGRALINPFDPSHITIRLTSNRRRWSHIFPKGPSGQLIQQHHYQARVIPQKLNKSLTTDTCYATNSSNGHGETKTKGKPNIPSLSGLLTPHSVNRKSLTLLWGATGEQEWTPALTTGVDWKSLTIPACLPITTDYFPDEVCLCRDYVFSDYNLLPDDVNADYAQQRVIYRKPLQTREVFQELISQRLSQGFQVIVEEANSQSNHSSNQSSIVVAGSKATDSQRTEEYKLSIGRIFHRIALNGSEIRVTRYRPRHPYPPFNFHYWYRFQAPDHPTYGVSWISFTTEKLENFNWNYLDHYICTRGDTDFPLYESLKFWRFRIYILPFCQSGTKRILEGSEHCNVYSALNSEEQKSLTENFVKYIETWVNKIRRQHNHVNKQRLDLSGLNVPNHMTRRRHSTGIISLKSSMVGNSPFRERLGSNRLPEKPRPRSGSKVLDRGRASPAIDTFVTSSADTDSLEGDQELSPFSLKEGCSHEEIAEHMKSISHGVGLLTQLPGLPRQTFVSLDAVQWAISHVDGITTQQQALDLFQEMIREKIICHASGDFSQKFIIGFYLYQIVKGSWDDSKGESELVGDLQGFENEWVEVEVREDLDADPTPPFLRSTLPHPCSQADQKGPLYKESHLEVDVQSKSDRVEWGHVKYQATYRPSMAYEMVVKWLASSGSIITDLILGWARKAQVPGLQMIPIPADPFALPYSLKSDPLRGPLFIPLDTEALMGTKSYLFEEFPEETRAQRLVLFQEAIALSFGFIACAIDSSQHLHNQYVHLSGNVFLMIPSVMCEHANSETSSSRSRPVRRLPSEVSSSITLHHEYITRHVGGKMATQETRVGFLWSWNHMVSKRWKLGPMNATSDETFQNKLLNDFRHFCTNENNRLKIFWDSVWDKFKDKEVKKSS